MTRQETESVSSVLESRVLRGDDPRERVEEEGTNSSDLVGLESTPKSKGRLTDVRQGRGPR